MPEIKFDTVLERDMDTLFMNALVCEKGFLEFFISKTDLENQNIKLINVELSKMDGDGESVITVICEIDNKKIGLLIEDKINAMAMPEQCCRYTKRGNTGIKNGDYDSFRVFIVAPQNYYESNDEAKKYPHFVSYEECKDFFSLKEDLGNNLRVQQINQAIVKSKHVSSVVFDEGKNAFLRKYVELQRKNFPLLDCSANLNVSSKGWGEFRTDIPNTKIVHKHDRDLMDLQFSGALDFESNFKILRYEFEKLGVSNLIVSPSGNSYSVRLNVPHISFEDPFDDSTIHKLNECFAAADTLNTIAKIIYNSSIILNR